MKMISVSVIFEVFLIKSVY